MTPSMHDMVGIPSGGAGSAPCGREAEWMNRPRKRLGPTFLFRFAALAVALSILVSVVPARLALSQTPTVVVSISDEGAQFTDIAGHPDEANILALVELGVVNGYGGGMFGPDDLVTREQFAKMIVLAAGFVVDADDPSPSLTFRDSSAISDWAKPYVARAVEEGLINGMGDNTFAPKDKVTRAQALTMIARALTGETLGATDSVETATAFADDEAIQPWARSAIMVCIEQKIVGLGDYESLEPQKPSTRAMNCRFLARFVGALGWLAAPSESITFNATDGATLDTASGLVVSVSGCDCPIQATLEVKTLSEPPAPTPILEAIAAYDVSLAAEEKLPGDATVSLTFPVPPGVDPADIVILHEVDGRWTLAQGDLTIQGNEITLVADHLSKYMLSAILPEGGQVKAPVTMKTTSSLDEEGNIVVTATVDSASGLLRMLDAPWMRLSIDPDPSLLSASSPDDLLDLYPGLAEDILGVGDGGLPYQGVLSPARAREIVLKFPGTGGSTRLHLSTGWELLPFIAADIIYGLAKHQRMPWPLSVGDFASHDSGIQQIQSLMRHCKEQLEYEGEDAKALNRVFSATLWLANEIFSWEEGEYYQLVGKVLPTKYELIYGVGAIALNSIVYALKGWNSADYVVVAVPDGLSLKIEPSMAALAPGESVEFRVKAFDADGNSLSVGDVRWGVSGGGSIKDGTFTAYETAEGQFTVTAFLDYAISTVPVEAQAEVTVTPTRPTGSSASCPAYRVIENARLNSIDLCSDGGYIVAGWRDGAWLMKTNAQGQEEWSRLFDPEGEIACVIQTSDGGYVAAGQTSISEPDCDGWVAKTDAEGRLLWSRTFGSATLPGCVGFTVPAYDVFRSVCETADGSYVMTGETQSYDEAGGWLVKVDSQGNEQWTRTYGGGSLSSVRRTIDGGFVLVGSRFSTGLIDVWLIKTDSQGEQEWAHTYGGPGRDEGDDVRQTSDGGYVVGGCTYSSGEGGADALLLKVDSSGEELWSRTFGEERDDGAAAVELTRDGGYIAAGTRRTAYYTEGIPDPSVVCNGCLIKTDSQGYEEWCRTFGGDLHGAARVTGVKQTADGGYVLVGYTRHWDPFGWDAWIMKTDSQGRR